ncbi:hypothetical protein MtrunA17_Chr2g0308261 [Medicago truncatula]|uniref:Uncharacterized protein n=1 Tax=Medicago truncatula TaxID=3880 RepID=A0A396JCC4_MEDTR|nr:hypothetical protein MtrunA17_Chr2g0308261 [Medicago truncatula]
MHWGNALCAPCMQKVGPQLSFPASVLGKARIFSTNPGRNSHYKYRPSSFRISRSELEQIKRKETLELRRVSIFSLIFLALLDCSLYFCERCNRIFGT